MITVTTQLQVRRGRSGRKRLSKKPGIKEYIPKDRVPAFRG